MKQLTLILFSILIFCSCGWYKRMAERQKEICTTFKITDDGNIDYVNKEKSERKNAHFKHWSDYVLRFASDDKKITFHQKLKDFVDVESHVDFGESKMVELSFSSSNRKIKINQYYYCYQDLMEIDGYIGNDRFGFYLDSYNNYTGTDDTNIFQVGNYRIKYLQGYKDDDDETDNGRRHALYLRPNESNQLEYVVWDKELGIVEFKLINNNNPYYRIFNNPTRN